MSRPGQTDGSLGERDNGKVTLFVNRIPVHFRAVFIFIIFINLMAVWFRTRWSTFSYLHAEWSRTPSTMMGQIIIEIESVLLLCARDDFP